MPRLLLLKLLAPPRLKLFPLPPPLPARLKLFPLMPEPWLPEKLAFVLVKLAPPA